MVGPYTGTDAVYFLFNQIKAILYRGGRLGSPFEDVSGRNEETVSQSQSGTAASHNTCYEMFEMLPLL